MSTSAAIAPGPDRILDTIPDRESAGSISLALAAEGGATSVVTLDNEAATFRCFLNRSEVSIDSHFNPPWRAPRLVIPAAP
jgi:hypothetical protein